MESISAGVSVRPWILARTASRLLGEAAEDTVTSVPTASASRWKAGSAKPSSLGPTMLSSSVTSKVASNILESSRSSTRLNPRNTSGRSAFERREMTTTFSRPVSRFTRRTFSCGREVSADLIA
jgi:hypothetical protein